MQWILVAILFLILFFYGPYAFLLSLVVGFWLFIGVFGILRLAEINGERRRQREFAEGLAALKQRKATAKSTSIS